MMRKVLFFIVLCFIILGAMYGYLYVRWNHLWSLSLQIPPYRTVNHHDDTLRVIMIGDSWAEMHSDMQMDSFLCSQLRKEVARPVTVATKGKGGKKSREIYQSMFKNDDCGTQQLLATGADYCVIFAGINDAAANWGTKQYCYHYKSMIDFLLQNSICPVVIEIPDVDIWNMYNNKPMKDLLTDFIKSTMTRSVMYDYHEYREALYEMLQKEGLSDKVVYVPMAEWNGEGFEVNPQLFFEDRVHLNNEGYHKLDECISAAIANHLYQSKDSAFVNNLMHQDAQ